MRETLISLPRSLTAHYMMLYPSRVS